MGARSAGMGKINFFLCRALNPISTILPFFFSVQLEVTTRISAI